MSDEIKHECGLAFIRLRKNISYYHKAYGTSLFGLNKLYLLMEKQHNRGQDGAGVATVKLNVQPGYPFLNRVRSAEPQAIADVFQKIMKPIQELQSYLPKIDSYPGLMKGYVDSLGELLLGHLRYGTQGKNKVEFCHPFIKQDVVLARNIALAGNFNLVNTEDLYQILGREPGEFEKQSDLAAMIEVLYHELCINEENNLNNPNLVDVLKNSFSKFDGGYTVGGLLGHGYSFVIRDPFGIRPAYYYVCEDYIAAASERAAIRTTFNLPEEQVLELMPGNALIIDEKGNYKIEEILPAQERKACSFERIYFSRGSDEKIYKERIELGRKLTKAVLKSIDNDLKNSIFSFIPNTAETAFYGLIKGAEDYLNQIKVNRIKSWDKNYTDEQLNELINRRIRIEKIAIKDVKLRTFITADSSRNEMVQHVYDITYGTVRKGIDNLIVIDDSIVRGTTLKESIIKMLGRLEPKKILILSSAPQIRYPDCYGIDMSKLGDFVVFRAAVELLKQNNQENKLQELYAEAIELKKENKLHKKNIVKEIYKPFNVDELSNMVAKLITPENFNIPVEVIFQSIEDLHECCPNNLGDWYFTGNYPTPGGNKVVNQAFINFIEGVNKRGY